MKKNNDIYEWDWGKELDEIDRELENHLNKIDLDDKNIDWERVQEDNKRRIAEMLRGSLGRDIDDVTSGKVKIKLPLRLKAKYWIKRFFEIFS